MHADLSSRYRWAAWTLIAVVALLRLLYLACWCPLDLSPDEAYYWDWSRQLDWSYHSKGPLVAWLIRLSCELFGDTMFAVRLPAVACGSLLLLGLFTLTRQIYQSDRRAFGLVALALTLPIVAVGSSLMTIDAPFTCAWMWALVFGHRAVFHQAPWAWWAAGLGVLVGVLAKATMVLWIPSFALFLATTPALRGQFRRPGLWIMTGIGALGGVPILAWNAANDWVTLKHSQMHAGFEENARIHWLGPIQYVGAQLALLLGAWFVVWIIAMWRHRPMVETAPELGFLWWMSAPTFVFFGLFSFTNGGGEPNWPLVAYLSGMILAAGWLVNWSQESAVRSQGWIRAGTIAFAALGLLMTALLHEPASFQPVLLRLAGPATPERPMPMRRVDPTCRLRGWRHLAAEVDRARAELQARGIEPIVAAERWTQAGQLAFYGEGHPTIYCFGVALGDRDSQYDLWRPNPIADLAHFEGRTFLLVGLEMDRLRDRFESLEETRLITYHESGQQVAEWTITIAHGYRP